MRKLATRIEKKGFVYEQINRNEFKAQYRQLDKEGNIVGHEVFYIGHAKETEAFGKTFPEREVYPSDNDFGVTAWSTGRFYQDATNKYISLPEKVRPEPV